MTVYYIYREFLGPLVSGALTEFFDFQSSAVVSERDKINFFVNLNSSNNKINSILLQLFGEVLLAEVNTTEYV